MKTTLKFYFLIFKLFLKGNSITSIQKIIEEYKYKIMMLEFRSNALLFGFDVNNYSDEEILEMVSHAGNQISSCGITIQEASEAFNNISKEMIEYNPKFT